MSIARTCGTCRECCRILAVDELPKPQWTKCAHVGVFGCTIYERRPTSCRAFKCLWLNGTMQTDREEDAVLLRPDKLGIMVDFQRDTRFGQVFKIFEVWPGAADAPAAAAVIGAFASSMLTIVMGRRHRRIFGPREAVEAASKLVAAAGYAVGPTEECGPAKGATP